MNADETEARLNEQRERKSYWVAIVKQWNDLTPMAPIPALTRAYAEKMIRKLEAEERG